MARFSVDFLGCKVSHIDAQELRERLAAEGHLETTEAVDVAVINTCCVTHEAVRKSRQAARRAARRAARVYVTGCGARLEGAFDGLPANVTVVSVAGERAPEFVARDVGAIGRASCSTACGLSSRFRTAAVSRAVSASSLRCAEVPAAARRAKCSPSFGAGSSRGTVKSS